MASTVPQTPSAAVAAGGGGNRAAAASIIDLDSIPDQIGNAILRVTDGTILRPPTGSLTEQDVEIIYRMMLEIGTILEGGTGGKYPNRDNYYNNEVVEGLQRVAVGFKKVSYAVTLGGSDGCLYIVKKKSSL